MKWKEPTFGPTPLLRSLMAANARRKAQSFDLEAEQKQLKLVYPEWAKEWLQKYKEAWYIAEANGDKEGMRKAKELADGLRDKLREMEKMPPWAQEQMQKQTVRWMEANEDGNVRAMKAAAEAGNGIREKLEMIDRIKKTSPQDAERLNDLTAKWYAANDKGIVDGKDMSNKPEFVKGAKENYSKEAQAIMSKYSLPKQDPVVPPVIGGTDVVKPPPSPSSDAMSFSYINKDGKRTDVKWTISNEEFEDYTALTQKQITEILNKKNPGLVKRGFDTAIYNYSQKIKINPKVMLATLGQEQGWCKNGNYDKAFGVGPGGEPGSFADGGIAAAAKTYLKWFNKGKEMEPSIATMVVNQDLNGKETKAVFGNKADTWKSNHPQYVAFMKKGIEIKPVNAAMYAKLKYTPWIDFPPQNSHPLEDWQAFFRSF
ncbi:hypothetical protein P4H70_28045 [Paenibacillus ehimensis]|uniref:hypothetical protein n=1 Tax=Paenibacillus ehimensis TaxID=79264 RepID=UPI002DBC1DCD|nr:hypothetical protein [Paenibacillus ehimensis]MEC0212786.1 hypothetical protein [Paenibacillus ehimensis]